MFFRGMGALFKTFFTNHFISYFIKLANLARNGRAVVALG
jgi:hypothetical protein